MIQATSGELAKKDLKLIKSKGTGRSQWRTQYIGAPSTNEIGPEPQAFLVDLPANGSIVPHFHQIDQFQVFVAGSGSLGRNAVPLIALHYVDHHTAYGPLNSGPTGLTFFTIRARSDSGPVYLHNPQYKDFLQPSKKRYLLTDNILLSTEPVLQNRNEVSLENLFHEVDLSDGLGAYMLRLGAGMKTSGPDPGVTGGQYYLVVNGSMQLDGAGYAAWSTVYAGPGDSPVEVCAGPHGLETLILNFPQPDS